MSQQKQACCATFYLLLQRAHAQIAKDAPASLLNARVLLLEDELQVSQQKQACCATF